MKTGKVKKYNEKSGYGFVEIDNSNKSIFFHKSGVIDEIEEGDKVSFEISMNQRGPIAVNIRLVTSDKVEVDINDQYILDNIISTNPPNGLDSKKVIQSISDNWKLEAKLESEKNYFYHFNEVNLILNKTKYYIIGRKGSGKSSISEFLLNQSSFDKFCEKLSFKNFPFNELYGLDNQKYTPPNQYITLWKYLIYSTVAKLMVGNERIDPIIRGKLKEIYKPDPIRSLSRTINKWTSAEFGASVLGTGGTLKLSKECISTNTDWIERVSALEDIILEYCDQSDYFIIFDELDEDYRSIKSEEHLLYNYLLTSLFKAVQDIKSFFRNSKVNVCPIIFLRDDIYSLIKDADKNKWRDFKIEIEWNPDKIKELLAYRISQDAESVQQLSFQEAWNLIFAHDTIKAGSRGSKTFNSFDYITRSTHLRPRDYIRYFQVCCEKTISLGKSKVSNETIQFVDRAFSNYLKDEIVDELTPLLPNIEDILQVISSIRKQSFSFAEFKEVYEKYFKDVVAVENVDYIIDILYKFSVLGNQNKRRPEVLYFKYMQTNMNLNKNEHLVVHRGLFKALQIL